MLTASESLMTWEAAWPLLLTPSVSKDKGRAEEGGPYTLLCGGSYGSIPSDGLDQPHGYARVLQISKRGPTIPLVCRALQS